MCVVIRIFRPCTPSLSRNNSNISWLGHVNLRTIKTRKHSMRQSIEPPTCPLHDNLYSCTLPSSTRVSSYPCNISSSCAKLMGRLQLNQHQYQNIHQFCLNLE